MDAEEVLIAYEALLQQREDELKLVEDSKGSGFHG